jgi:hypothetical protein
MRAGQFNTESGRGRMQYLYINLGKEILKAVANAHNPSKFSLSCLAAVGLFPSLDKFQLLRRPAFEYFA